MVENDRVSGVAAGLLRKPGAPLGGLLESRAITQVAGASLATRNTSGFADLGLDLVDPWQAPEPFSGTYSNVVTHELMSSSCFVEAAWPSRHETGRVRGGELSTG